jgi:ABC-type uncharacterized transport system YnjBCD ATPase subunit
MAALVLEGVVVRDGTDTQAVSLAVEPGHVVGLQCGSRSESRAFARAVGGVGPGPVDGSIAPDHDQIAYIPAGGGLLPQLTVHDNVTYRLAADMARGVVDSEVSTVLTELRLVGVQNRLPHEISAEQRARTAFARAALRYPAALVVDLPAAEDPPLRSIATFARPLLEMADPIPVLVCTDSRVIPDWAHGWQVVGE